MVPGTTSGKRGVRRECDVVFTSAKNDREERTDIFFLFRYPTEPALLLKLASSRIVMETK